MLRIKVQYNPKQWSNTITSKMITTEKLPTKTHKWMPPNLE